ncbi:MAG: 6-carboxytetrahydropterin synthase, partial [Candidatus Omnitrophota bacterium]
EAIDELDHKYLNDIDYFKEVNPTSENIAKYIYENLSKKADLNLEEVTVYETDTSSATYSE